MAEYKWNLNELFANDDDPRLMESVAAARAAADAFALKWREREDYLTDVPVLGEALADYEQFFLEHGAAARAEYYTFLRRSVDQNDSKLKALATIIEKDSAEISNQLKFFELKLGKTTVENQEKMLAAVEIAPYQ